MANKEKGIIKRSFKSLFNVPKWISWSEIASNGKLVISLAKGLFEQKEAERYESFADAITRLGLSEDDLKKRQKDFLRTTIIYFFIALVLLSYSMYLLFNAHLLAGLISILLALLVFAYGYRENIGYLQIKQRKLGITFSDWISAILNKKVK